MRVLAAEARHHEKGPRMTASLAEGGSLQHCDRLCTVGPRSIVLAAASLLYERHGWCVSIGH